MELVVFSCTALVAAMIITPNNKHHSPKIDLKILLLNSCLMMGDREFCESLMLNIFKEHNPSVDIDAMERDVALANIGV